MPPKIKLSTVIFGRRFLWTLPSLIQLILLKTLLLCLSTAAWVYLWLSLIFIILLISRVLYDVDLGAVAVQIYSILEVLRDKKLSLSDKILPSNVRWTVKYRRQFFTDENLAKLRGLNIKSSFVFSIVFHLCHLYCEMQYCI